MPFFPLCLIEHDRKCMSDKMHSFGVRTNFCEVLTVE